VFELNCETVKGETVNCKGETVNCKVENPSELRRKRRKKV
jgi:hypothetical protein